MEDSNIIEEFIDSIEYQGKIQDWSKVKETYEDPDDKEFSGFEESILEGGAGSGHWGHKGRSGRRGGSVPGKAVRDTMGYFKREYVVSNEQIFRRKLRITEIEIATRQTERGIIYDRMGNKLFDKEGDEHQISWVFKKDELVKISGGVFTHNHPSGKSFSPEDIEMGMLTGVKEVRAVGEGYIHSMRIRQRGLTFEERSEKIDGILELYKIEKTNVREKLEKGIRDGRVTMLDANKYYYHEVWKEVARKTPWITYERKKW